MQTIETSGAIKLMHRVTTKSGHRTKNHCLIARTAIKLPYIQISNSTGPAQNQTLKTLHQ